MNKNYHEHCKEEHDEALRALEHAKELEKENISISYYETPTRKRVISVPKRKLRKTIISLQKAGKKNIQIKH